jgi:hypothetical protein
MTAWHGHPIPVLDQLGEINGGRKKKCGCVGARNRTAACRRVFSDAAASMIHTHAIDRSHMVRHEGRKAL